MKANKPQDRIDECKHHLNELIAPNIPDSPGVWLFQCDYDLIQLPLDISKGKNDRLCWYNSEGEEMYVDEDAYSNLGEWGGRYITPYEFTYIKKDIEYLISEVERLTKENEELKKQ